MEPSGRAANDHPAVRQALPELNLRPDGRIAVARGKRAGGVRIASTDMIDVFLVSLSSTCGVMVMSPKVA